MLPPSSVHPSDTSENRWAVSSVEEVGKVSGFHPEAVVAANTRDGWLGVSGAPTAVTAAHGDPKGRALGWGWARKPGLSAADSKVAWGDGGRVRCSTAQLDWAIARNA
jgi:hypothetical protein